MRSDSKAAHAVRVAESKGYRITREGVLYGVKGKPAKSRCSAGYIFTIICTSIGRCMLYVHQLQAFNKFGERIFEEGLEIRHVNGCHTDNSWDNIELGTHSENMQDKPAEQRMRNSKNGCLAKRKYTPEQVLHMWELKKAGHRHCDIARECGIHQFALRRIFKGGAYADVKAP